MAPNTEGLLRKQDVAGNYLGPMPVNHQRVGLLSEELSRSVNPTQLDTKFKMHTITASFVNNVHKASL
jgi:hypothetical protein